MDATALRQSSATYSRTLSPHCPLLGLSNVIVSIAQEKKIKIYPMHKKHTEEKQSYR